MTDILLGIGILLALCAVYPWAVLMAITAATIYWVVKVIRRAHRKVVQVSHSFRRKWWQ